MTKTKRKEYETPQVEQIVARVEKGFAGSGAADGPRTQEGNESLTEGNSYTGSDFD